LERSTDLLREADLDLEALLLGGLKLLMCLKCSCMRLFSSFTSFIKFSLNCLGVICSLATFCLEFVRCTFFSCLMGFASVLWPKKHYLFLLNTWLELEHCIVRPRAGYLMRVKFFYGSIMLWLLMFGFSSLSDRRGVFLFSLDLLLALCSF
jgi:hypothetical protein